MKNWMYGLLALGFIIVYTGGIIYLHMKFPSDMGKIRKEIVAQ